MNSSATQFPVLNEGTVKDWEDKLKNIGRPTVFIGSSLESREIVEQVKNCFPKEEFAADPWYDGIFGKTRKTGGEISNAEWLKNFTDIYDFAIFIFVPDDETISLTRFDAPGGQARQARTTRHNVVFECGLFLGRLGAKKTFILFDESHKDFVEKFFTDLNENLNDTESGKGDGFRIELYMYKNASDSEGIKASMTTIKNQIRKSFEDVDLGFLPSTSLAVGYFNNCIKLFVDAVYEVKNNPGYKPAWIKDPQKELEVMAIAAKIKEGKDVRLKIVIPDSLEGAVQEKFLPDFPKEKFRSESFPAINRPLTLACHIIEVKETSGKVIFYDVPTTMNSSLEAIEMTTQYEQIIALLKEKERRNFKKALARKIMIAQEKEPHKQFTTIIEIISREQFIKETT